MITRDPTNSIRRVAMLSVHASPLALMGGKKTGGMNVYVRDFGQALARHGVCVDIFTRAEEANLPSVDFELGPGCQVIHMPAGPRHSIPVGDIEQHLDEFAAGVVAFGQANRAHYDLIHSHYWLSGLVAERLKAYWGDLPVIQMFHTLGHMKNQIAQDETEEAPQARLDGETHVIQHVADRIIAATPAERQQLIEYYGADSAKIDIISPGVDLERFQPIEKDTAKKRVGIPCGDTNLLFVGRIEPLKGIDTLLRAMSLLQEQAPKTVKNTCVAIIGGDPWADDLDAEMARLHSLRAELDIHDLVTFLGAKDQEVLPCYYAAAEMVIMPSHYESFGMVALEAMAMGTPVIASEVGGLAHLVQHGINGFHVPSRDPQALADRILDLLEHPELRSRLGKQAREYARDFAWDTIVERMLEVYAQAVPASHPIPCH